MDKPMVLMLLKKIAQESKPEGSYESSSMMSSNEGKYAACQEMMSALRSSNVGAFKTALESFISMCGHSEEEDSAGMDMDY